MFRYHVVKPYVPSKAADDLKMTAIKTLVVQGNQAKRKNTKRSKIAPSPIGEMEAQVVRGTCVQGASVSAVFYFSNVRQKTIEPEFEAEKGLAI